MADLLGDFERAFDHAKARKEGTIVPTKGARASLLRYVSSYAINRRVKQRLILFSMKSLRICNAVDTQIIKTCTQDDQFA